MKKGQNIVVIVRKEALLIWRDKLSIAVLFFLPALIVLVFGAVLSFEIKELHIAVINERHEPAVERLFAQIEVSSNFHIVKRLHHSGEIAAAFGRDDIRMVIVAPGGFTRQLATGQYPDISLFIDASDPKLALAATSIARKIITAFVQEELPEMRPLQKQPVVRFLYNPGLRKETASVPGLMMIIFILISAIMLSISQRGRGSVAVKDDRLIRKRVDLFLEMGQHLAITVIDKAQAAFHQRITREQVRTARHKQADRTIGMPRNMDDSQADSTKRELGAVVVMMIYLKLFNCLKLIHRYQRPG
jgi:hypothetical protein